MSEQMQLNLIQTYCWVCDMFDKNPQWNYIRLSNNNQPADFTDQEAVTIYIFAGKYQRYFQISEIHEFATHYLYEWFPKLTSYTKFNHRLNVIQPIFYDMLLDIISNNIPQNTSFNTMLLDSMPIITSKSKNRTAKVAREITDKGYCSTKNLYYYGLKLHLLAYRRSGTMPFPNKIYLSSASENDLAVVREINWLDDLVQTEVFADKAYCNKKYVETRKQAIQLELFTPVKAIKGTPEHIKQHDLAYNNLFSNAVSKVRQPIESLFNWWIQKTNLQNANKVRSTNGLLMHCFGKLTIAMLNCIF